MTARRFCVLRGQEVVLEDRAIRTLEHATTINAGSTPVLVDPAAWRFLNSIGVANAARRGNCLEVTTHPGLYARLTLAEDPYHSMLVGTPGMVLVPTKQLIEWVEAGTQAASVARQFVYAKRRAVFGLDRTSLYAAPLSLGLPQSMTATTRALDDFARELAQRPPKEAAVAEGVALAWGANFAVQMALTFVPIPVDGYELACVALRAPLEILAVAQRLPLANACARLEAVLQASALHDERIELRLRAHALRFVHDYATDEAPISPAARRVTWAVSSDSLRAVRALRGNTITIGRAADHAGRLFFRTEHGDAAVVACKEVL